MNYYLGIDGGGSSCRAHLENTAGDLLGSGRAGPANVASDAAQALANIELAAREALAAAGLTWLEASRVHAVAGLAGYNLAAGRSAVSHWQLPFATTQITSDMHIACAGAHAGEDGAIMILGTGSSAVVVLAGQLQEVGGYGFPIGDQASGAQMGLAAVQLTLQMCDQLIAPTSLLQAVLQHFNAGDAAQLSQVLQKAPPARFAELAPLVLSHASQNDSHARAIIAEACNYIVVMLARLQSLGALKLALVGGLAPLLQPQLPAQWQARLSTPELSPVAGAALMARRLARAQCR